jgi:hypothetical protein
LFGYLDPEVQKSTVFSLMMNELPWVTRRRELARPAVDSSFLIWAETTLVRSNSVPDLPSSLKHRPAQIFHLVMVLKAARQQLGSAR